MRIISKFKDYYDSALAFGQDKTVVFVRDNQYLDPKRPENKILETVLPKFNINTKTKNNTQIAFGPVLVVFCGKLYRGVMCNRKTKPEPIKGLVYQLDENETKVFYKCDELEDYLTLYGMKLPEERKYFWQTDRNSDNLKTYLANQGTLELSEYCISNRFVTLTFMEDVATDNYRREQTWYANSSLSHAQFYKVFDSFSAYQELDMFISGTLPQSTAMPIQIEDKYRIQQHGFDKYSFRKAPTKK